MLQIRLAQFAAPLRLTVSGEVDALLTICTAAVRVPVATGANEIEKVQLPEFQSPVPALHLLLY